MMFRFPLSPVQLRASLGAMVRVNLRRLNVWKGLFILMLALLPILVFRLQGMKKKSSALLVLNWVERSFIAPKKWETLLG